jgi:hypothetical protein
MDRRKLLWLITTAIAWFAVMYWWQKHSYVPMMAPELGIPTHESFFISKALGLTLAYISVFVLITKRGKR